jgi:hypothetical protein
VCSVVVVICGEDGSRSNFKEREDSGLSVCLGGYGYHGARAVERLFSS